MEDKKPEVLIVGDDGEARRTSEVLADNFDVAVLAPKRKHGHIGYGNATMQALSMVAMASSMGLGIHTPELNKLFRPSKQLTKCLLPSCEEYTSHNSGYCSKECKVENQYKLKRANNLNDRRRR